MAKKRIDIPDDDMTAKLAGTVPSPPPYPTVAPVAPIPPPIVVMEVVKKIGGRPKKEASANRIKYTTSLTKETIRFLRVEAAMRDISPADLLDTIINNFREKGK
jgi:hypothetical protein